MALSSHSQVMALLLHRGVTDVNHIFGDGGVSNTLLLAFLIGVGSLELTKKLGLEGEDALGRSTLDLLDVDCKSKAAVFLLVQVH